METTNLPEEQQERLSFLCHELKGPLGVALNSIQLLQDKVKQQCAAQYAGDDEFEALFYMSTRSVYRTLRLVGNLVDAERFSSGCMSLLPCCADLHRQLQQCAQNIADRLERRGASLTLECDTTGPFWFWCDASAFDRMVYNLLTNALTHLPQQGGCIGLRLYSTPEAAVLEVCDNGSGFDEEAMAHAFEKYCAGCQRQGEERRTVGLGLYIVRGYAELQGGTVSISARPEGGTQVRVFLPRVAPLMNPLFSQSASYEEDQQHLMAMIELSDVP